MSSTMSRLNQIFEMLLLLKLIGYYMSFSFGIGFVLSKSHYGFSDLHTRQNSMLYLSGRQISWKKCRQLNTTIFIFSGSEKNNNYL